MLTQVKLSDEENSLKINGYTLSSKCPRTFYVTYEFFSNYDGDGESYIPTGFNLAVQKIRNVFKDIANNDSGIKSDNCITSVNIKPNRLVKNSNGGSYSIIETFMYQSSAERFDDFMNSRKDKFLNAGKEIEKILSEEKITVTKNKRK